MSLGEENTKEQTIKNLFNMRLLISKTNEELSREFAIEENKKSKRLRMFLQHNIHRTIRFTVDFRPIQPLKVITAKAGNWKLEQNKFGCWYISTQKYSGILSSITDVCVVFE